MIRITSVLFLTCPSSSPCASTPRPPPGGSVGSAAPTSNKEHWTSTLLRCHSLYRVWTRSRTKTSGGYIFYLLAYIKLLSHSAWLGGTICHNKKEMKETWESYQDSGEDGRGDSGSWCAYLQAEVVGVRQAEGWPLHDVR